MCLIITTTSYLNNTKEVFNKLRENDALCIVYGDNDEGLSVEAVDELLKKNVDKRFIYLDRKNETEAAFNLGFLIGKENEKKVVLLSDDELFKTASELLKNQNVLYKEERKEEKAVKVNNSTEKPNKTPAKRGRKPKAKPQEVIAAASA